MDTNINLPTVAERLKDLEPSKEVLDFYRNRLSLFEKEDSKIVARLSEFKHMCSNVYELEKDLMEREEENAALRQSLSDLQARLFEERELILRLYAENDRLKIRELEDRKKIQRLIHYCEESEPSFDVEEVLKNFSENVGTTGKNQPKFRPKSNATSVARQQQVFIKQQQLLKQTKPKSVEDFDNTHLFKLKIEGLKSELEEQTKYVKEHIADLTEDLSVTRSEAEGQRKKDSKKIASLNEKLKISQDLLSKMTEDSLQQIRKHQAEEQSWFAQRDEMAMHIRTLRRMVAKEKAQMTAQAASLGFTNREGSTVHGMSKASSLVSLVPPGFRQSQSSLSLSSNALHTLPNMKPVSQAPQITNARAEIQMLHRNLEKSKKLCETYRSQCVKLEEELALLREQKDAGKHLMDERNEKLANQVKSFSTQFKQLEKRHKFEIEGFKSDIKLLKTHLDKVEKSLAKAATQLGHSQIDSEALETIHKTTTKSKYLHDNLRSMKAQIAQLERDLRLV